MVVAAGMMSGCSVDGRGVVARLPVPRFESLLDRPARVEPKPTIRPEPQRRKATRDVPRGWIPPGGVSDRWKYIVIHHSGGASGNAAQFDRYHRIVKHWNELGYHFVIGNGTGSGDGEVEVGSRWVKQKHGAHCKTPSNEYNDHGIGICLVGDFSRSAPSAAQMASLSKLVRFLVDQCGISSANIVTHRGVTGKTICPGRYFPMYAIKKAVGGGAVAAALP